MSKGAVGYGGQKQAGDRARVGVHRQDRKWGAGMEGKGRAAHPKGPRTQVSTGGAWTLFHKVKGKLIKPEAAPEPLGCTSFAQVITLQIQNLRR